MKKIVLLLAALLILSSFIYADVGVGIWGRTVFIAAAGSDVPEDYESWIWQGWGPDWGGGPQMGIAVWWTSETMEYHFKYKFNSIQITQNSEIAEAYGIIKVVPDLMTVQMGYRDEQNDFRETTPVSAHDLNCRDVGRFNNWGVVVMVEPKDMNLKIGLQWRMPIGAGGYGITGTDLPIQYNMYNVGLCASYTMPEMVKVTVGTVIDGEAYQGDSDLSNPTGGMTFPNQERAIFARIHLLMVPDLTAWLLVKYVGLEGAETEYDLDMDGETDGVGDITIMKPFSFIDVLLGAKYVMGDFSVGMSAYLQMKSYKEDDPEIELGDLDESKMTIEVNVDPNYNMGNMTVGAVCGVKTIVDDDDNEEGMNIYVEPYITVPAWNSRIGAKVGLNNNLLEPAEDVDDDYTWSLYWQADFSFW